MTWFFIVCFAFGISLLLIHDIYSDWQEFPISTTTLTHPISELKFPNVSVCPLKGSHTALNYDLLMVGNGSLTEEYRYNVMKATSKVIEAEHRDYIDNMMVMNPSIRQVYQGFQSLPKSYGNSGLEIRMWNSSGTVETGSGRRRWEHL